MINKDSRYRRGALAATAAVLAAVALGGCTAPEQPAIADATATSTPAVATATATAAAAPKHRHKRKRAPVARRASGLVACDTNITVRADTTSCPFAQNVFYAFYEDATPFKSQNSIQAYSPASQEDYAVACATDGAENVT